MVGTKDTKITKNCSTCAYWKVGININMNSEWGLCNKAKSDIDGAIDIETLAWASSKGVEGGKLNCHKNFSCNQYLNKKLLIIK